LKRTVPLRAATIAMIVFMVVVFASAVTAHQCHDLAAAECRFSRRERAAPYQALSLSTSSIGAVMTAPGESLASAEIDFAQPQLLRPG
jgi:hypothetical protein